MAINTRTNKSRSVSRRSLRYFYANGELHKVLRVVRPLDLVEAWSYPQGKTMVYAWSDVRKKMASAYTMQEVAAMIGRHRVQIENYILHGHIKKPQRTYAFNDQRTPGKYMFSEDDVLGLHDYLSTVHVGRPRRDGKVSPGKMPTKAELRAMMRHDIVTYVKTEDNEFRPTWKEVDW